MKRVFIIGITGILVIMSIMGALKGTGKYDRGGEEMAGKVTEKNLDDFGYGDIVVPYDLREISHYKVKNIDLILKYLDPCEMDRYDDLLTLFTALTLEVTDIEPLGFYDKNKDIIGDILGIYDRETFLRFSRLVHASGIRVDSNIDYIDIVDIVKADNLLKSSVKIYFDGGILSFCHYLNYIYVFGESYLYFYFEDEVYE